MPDRRLIIGPIASHPSQAATDPVQPVASHSQIDRSHWDARWGDGSLKGDGFLGVLARPDGGVTSEYSIADSPMLRDPRLVRRDNPDGYREYPSVVPTLTPVELAYILNMKEGDKLPQSIIDKATAYASMRHMHGQPLFAQRGEQRYDALPMFRRVQ